MGGGRRDVRLENGDGRGRESERWGEREKLKGGEGTHKGGGVRSHMRGKRSVGDGGLQELVMAIKTF